MSLTDLPRTFALPVGTMHVVSSVPGNPSGNPPIPRPRPSLAYAEHPRAPRPLGEPRAHDVDWDGDWGSLSPAQKWDEQAASATNYETELVSLRERLIRWQREIEAIGWRPDDIPDIYRVAFWVRCPPGLLDAGVARVFVPSRSSSASGGMYGSSDNPALRADGLLEFVIDEAGGQVPSYFTEEEIVAHLAAVMDEVVAALEDAEAQSAAGEAKR